MHKDEFIFYFDLDCFPISSLDNFIIDSDMGFAKGAVSSYCANHHVVYEFGTFLAGSNDRIIFGQDHYAICNNTQFGLRKVLQIHKELIAREKIVVYEGMIMN